MAEITWDATLESRQGQQLGRTPVEPQLRERTWTQLWKTSSEIVIWAQRDKVHVEQNFGSHNWISNLGTASGDHMCKSSLGIIFWSNVGKQSRKSYWGCKVGKRNQTMSIIIPPRPPQSNLVGSLFGGRSFAVAPHSIQCTIQYTVRSTVHRTPYTVHSAPYSA